jgi:hypothetical protein
VLVRSAAILFVLLASSAAHAEQPRGTYILDRGAATAPTDGTGRQHPSCGGEKVFGGQATFVIEYGGDRIWVNEREWEFAGHTFTRGWAPAEKQFVVITDPKSKNRIRLWFGKAGVAAAGALHATGERDGKFCVDGWELKGKYSARLKPRN